MARYMNRQILTKPVLLDVVPNSEVEELKAIIADHKASEERWEELYNNAKVEVAREIFEEIESKLILNKAIHCGQKFYYTRIADDISELKKKYTEDPKT